jgi:hypothetical protein
MARPLRSARILALVAGAFTTALVACSLLTGLDADYKLQAASTGDGGKDGDVVPDGESDALPDTAQIDGGPDGTVPFCKRMAAGPDDFCWDFEESPKQGEPSWGWKDALQAASGVVTVVDGIGVNKSRALRASLSNPGAESGQAFLHHVLENRPSFASFRRHEMTFSYAITKKNAQLYTAVLGAQGFGTFAGQYVGASLYLPGAGTVDVSDPPGSLQGTGAPVVLDQRETATILIERTADGGPYKSTVTVGAAKVQENLAFDAGTSDAATEVWIGTFFSAPGDGGVTAIIDDVLVRQSN